MVHAQITISEIDYEKSFANLFPMAIKKCNEIEQPNLAVRFLNKMGSASMAASFGILNRMEERHKGELLCGLVNQYCKEIQSLFNAFLKKDALGQNIRIGELYMVQDANGHLSFMVWNIKVDYANLVKNDTVKQKIGDFANQAVKKSVFGKIEFIQKIAADGAGIAAEAAVTAAPNAVEKKVLSIMNKEENKEKLLKMAGQVLEEKGLCLKPEEFVFTQEEFFSAQDDQIVENARDRKFELSPELEEGLLEAVAGYLKTLLEERAD